MPIKRVIHIKGCVSIGWNDSSWLYGIIQHCGWYKKKHVILLYTVCMHIYIYIYNYTYIRHYIIICFLWMCTLTQTCTVFWKPLLRFPPSSGIDVNMMPFRMGDKEPWRRMWCHTYDIIWVHEYQSEERLLATYIHIVLHTYMVLMDIHRISRTICPYFCPHHTSKKRKFPKRIAGTNSNVILLITYSIMSHCHPIICQLLYPHDFVGVLTCFGGNQC